MKFLPNILITGTPGVGKSRLCTELTKLIDLEWIDVSKFAIEHNCVDEFDDEFKCPVLNEEKVLDMLEEKMEKSRGYLIDYHSSEFFPERWFDAVFILTTSTEVLYDRLSERGYRGKKLENNMMCEIHELSIEEAKEAYKDDIIHVLSNCNEDELKSNVNYIFDWINTKWRKNF